MSKAYIIKQGLSQLGRKVFLTDGEWNSTPFYAVLEQRWKNNKSNFENKHTEIGFVSADYYTYIGPFDHDIEALSDNAFLCSDGIKYIFKKKEKICVNDETIYYCGVLRKVREASYD